MRERLTCRLDYNENESLLLSRKIGLAMIKPDSLALGIGEVLISEMCRKLYGIAILDYVCVAQIKNEEQIRAIYPNLSEDIYKILNHNLVDENVIVVSFRAKKNNTCDLWEELKKIKGPTMWNWNEDMLKGNTSPDFFIRGWLPLPGSNSNWQNIIAKVSKHERMTEEEFKIYSQNLLHTPETIDEFKGLLDLYPKNLRRRITRR